MSETQFATGRILFDNEGTVKALKKEANRWIRKKYMPVSEVSKELQKYSLWDALDNLQDIFEKKSPSFVYAYYSLLQQFFTAYAKFMRSPIIPPHKIYELLQDKNCQRKYLQKPFPDVFFKKLFVQAIKQTSQRKMLFFAEKITHRVFKKMGGFKIDGWKVRTPLILK